MIGYIIALASILALMALGKVLRDERIRLQSRKTETKSLPKPQAMSWISRAIMTKLSSLPESHKPAYDVKVAVMALDVKYDINRLDNHFNQTSYLGFSLPRCDCTDAIASKVRTCQRYPEFIELWNSMVEIDRALIRLDNAKRERERKIELAGIENDLRSVDDILAAFRQEAEVIRETAKEIS